MELYLIRHGQTVCNRERTIPNESDKLTSTGLRQARAAAGKLKSLSVDAILTSPHGRARETAKIIAGRLNKKFTVVGLLREKKLPAEIEGKPSKEKSVRRILDLMEKKNGTDPSWHYSNEENFRDIKKRGLKVLKKIKGLNNKGVAVVSHKYLIKLLLFLITKKPAGYRSFVRFYNSTVIGNGSVTVRDL